MGLETWLFTFEDGLWNVRGPYEKAFEEDEVLVRSDIQGEHVAHILIVSANFFYFLLFFFGWYIIALELELLW